MFKHVLKRLENPLTFSLSKWFHKYQHHLGVKVQPNLFAVILYNFWTQKFSIVKSIEQGAFA